MIRTARPIEQYRPGILYSLSGVISSRPIARLKRWRNANYTIQQCREHSTVAAEARDVFSTAAKFLVFQHEAAAVVLHDMHSM